MGGLDVPHSSLKFNVFVRVWALRQSGGRDMWKFVVNAKRVLWEFVELAFLTVLALLLIFLLLGQNAGPYVASVADNVTKFAAGASSGLLGVMIVLAIIYLVLRRTKAESGTAPRSSRKTKNAA